MQRIWCKSLILTLGFAVSFGCKKNNNNNNNNNQPPFQGGGSGGGPCCGGGGVVGDGSVGSGSLPTVDMSSAKSLLVVDASSTGASLVDLHNQTVTKLGLGDEHLLLAEPYLSLDATTSTGTATSSGTSTSTSTTDGSKTLQKTDKSGNVSNAMSPPSDSLNGGGQQPLPPLQTIAVSPKNEVFLIFQQPFQIKASAQGGDPMANGDSCQIFQVVGGTLAELQATPPTSTGNLLCLDPNHMINSWNGNLSEIQFDSAGNVYYPGQLPNAPTMVVYKWDRSSHALTEMINANICVSDFLVTPSGGMFYTGTSSCNGGGNSGNDGFFRYITSAGALTEIAIGWSQFIYEPVSTATTDQAVFFGPDPTSASVASWQDACLFNFNPAGGSTTAARTTSVVTCGQQSDIQNWLSMTRSSDVTQFGQGFNNNNDPSAAWFTEASNRCLSSNQIFAGGGNQISKIAIDSKGTTYVIGDVGKKIAGTVECGVNIRGPHCDITGMPNLTYADSNSCATAGGTWKDDGYCSNNQYATSTACFGAGGTWNRNPDFYSNVTTGICTAGASMSFANWNSGNNSVSQVSVTSAGANTPVYRIQYFSCQNPNSNGNWTAVYQGLGVVNSTSLTLNLLSGTTEQALNLWVINDVVYYSAFDVGSGEYELRTVNKNGSISTMASNLEVYHLSDAGDGTNLYFDGLDFSNNSYTFGTILQASPYTRASKTGLTGTLKTVVILPKS